MGFVCARLIHVITGGSGGMKSIAGLELLYPRAFQAKFREQLTCNLVSPVHRGWMTDI